ncbi:unnamed protein product [Merluccius merluccius]
MADNGEIARRDSRPTAAGGERREGEVEVGAGKKNVMNSRVEREEETLRHGGRYGGAAWRKEEDGEKGEIQEKGEMAEEEEEDVEEEGSGKEEALSGMETDEEERRESEEELEAVGGKESSSDSANATRGTQMLKGRSEVTEQRGGVESEDSGSRRGRSRSVLRSSDGRGNSLSEGQLSTSKGGHYARECGTDEEQRRQGGEGGGRETDVDEEEERPRGEGGEGDSGAEATESEGSGVGVGGEGEEMDEDEEQDGKAEDEKAAEETTETGGEKEREGNGYSVDSVVRGTDEREERRSAGEGAKGGEKNGEKSGMTVVGQGEGSYIGEEEFLGGFVEGSTFVVPGDDGEVELDFG